MSASASTSKRPGSFGLTGATSEFLEKGSKNIVSDFPALVFRQYFEANILKYAFFADFTETYPWPIDSTVGSVSIAGTTTVLAFDKLSIPGFTGTDSAGILNPGSVGYITRFIPFLIAYDTNTGLRTHSYSSSLQVFDNTTEIGTFGGAGVAPDIDDIYTSYIGAGLVVPAYDTGAGGTLTVSTNIKYTLKFTSGADPIRIEAFGLMYDVGVLS